MTNRCKKIAKHDYICPSNDMLACLDISCQQVGTETATLQEVVSEDETGSTSGSFSSWIANYFPTWKKRRM